MNNKTIKIKKKKLQVLISCQRILSGPHLVLGRISEEQVGGMKMDCFTLVSLDSIKKVSAAHLNYLGSY
jgi:hypothetical protein